VESPVSYGLPGFNGHEVMEKARRTRPDVPVPFTSGKSENAVHTDFVLHEGLVIFQKPYASDELLRILRRLLDG